MKMVFLEVTRLVTTTLLEDLGKDRPESVEVVSCANPVQDMVRLGKAPQLASNETHPTLCISSGIVSIP